ncbi:MAG TPA: potassium channel protein [Gemmataceae bacterium]|nr:potassium channel protein [Gemmataceae bacterium]
MPRRFILTLLVPALLLVAGTLGYHFIEGWSLFDSLYMTVTTLTTVGYGEVHPLSPAGRAFTMLLLLGGVFTLFYAAGELIRGIISGEVREALGRQRMARNLAELRNHMIVCGLGRMGRLVCARFAAGGIPFVVIDRDPKLLADFRMPHGLALHGDATSDEVLRQAGVERARALVTVTASDADNLYITMSGRLLNERLFIVSRAEEERARQKLLRAGANRVVSPYAIGGARVAEAVLRPAVVDFIELATRTEHLALQIEEVRVEAGSRLAGTTVRDSQLRQDMGIIVVAIKRQSGDMLFNPDSTASIEPGDTLITLGPRPQLDELERLARGR